MLAGNRATPHEIFPATDKYRQCCRECRPLRAQSAIVGEVRGHAGIARESAYIHLARRTPTQGCCGQIPRVLCPQLQKQFRWMHSGAEWHSDNRTAPSRSNPTDSECCLSRCGRLSLASFARPVAQIPEPDRDFPVCDGSWLCIPELWPRCGDLHWNGRR